MSRPRLLDLYCGAGGASMGYHRAGFDVVGVDRSPQPRYPFAFIEGDALTVLEAIGSEFDAIAASPPCQRYSAATKQHGRSDAHPDLVDPTRALLLQIGKPYVLENVPGAPLRNPILLCGSMFGLERLRRHRLFESNVVLLRMSCRHERQRDVVSVTGNAGGSSRRDGAARFATTDVWRELMGIHWMTGRELAEAIPPAYTEYIGKQLREALR